MGGGRDLERVRRVVGWVCVGGMGRSDVTLQEMIVTVCFGAAGSVRAHEGTKLKVDGGVMGFEGFFL